MPPAENTGRRRRSLPRPTAAVLSTPTYALVRRRLADARGLTVAFAYLFAIYAYTQPSGYRSAYPKLSDRLAFAHSFAANKGLWLLYGQPHDVSAVSGYTAWRVGGVLAIAAAIYGLLAAIRLTRAEEDSGRLELVLAGAVTRRTVNLAALAALTSGALILWGAELTGSLVAGLPLVGSGYLALATASIVPVCASLATLAGEFAPTRRSALELAGSAIALLFVLRVTADTVSGLSWLHWATPLGWAEQLRPFAGPQPLAFLLPASATLLLLTLAARISARRDLGTGLLPTRDIAAQALRSQIGVLLAWSGSVTALSFILGAVAKSISPADVSKSVQKEIGKLGSGAITTPTGYLAFIFIFVVLAVCVFVCAQIGAARREAADQRLETLLAMPVSRRRWLAGRAALAIVAAAALSLLAGVLAWAGASTGGAQVSLPTMLQAGANALPIATLFLGLAILAYAITPRSSGAIIYALLAISFFWKLVGSLLAVPRWLVDLTPFAHVAPVPTQPFRTLAAVTMIALGAVTTLAATELFRRRDLIGA
jgi:ABC-2 type transport system permease protein